MFYRSQICFSTSVRLDPSKFYGFVPFVVIEFDLHRVTVLRLQAHKGEKSFAHV